MKLLCCATDRRTAISDNSNCSFPSNQSEQSLSTGSSVVSFSRVFCLPELQRSGVHALRPFLWPSLLHASSLLFGPLASLRTLPHSFAL